MVHSTEDAEDLAQEVFIEVYLKFSQFREESTLKTWIYRIAVNKCLEYLRKKNAQKRKGAHLDLVDNLISPVGFDHPGVRMENRELARILFSAIAKLPENQRIAFTLHKVERLSHEEISAILEKSIASVESLIHRAKQNLKVSLKSYYEGAK